MHALRFPLRNIVVRALGFFGFWIMLAGTSLPDAVAGFVATAVATLVSLHLFPPTTTRINPAALLRLSLGFLRQSIIAGVDVALRALHPTLNLHPGFVRYRCHMSGRSLDAFCTMVSLLPGTLPVETTEDGMIVVHCLDTRLPIPEQLAREEAALTSVLRSEP